MQLNKIAKQPTKILSFILLTYLFSYICTGQLELSLILTLIPVWICMMPHLEVSGSCYEKYLPKFIVKSNIINIILVGIVPIVLCGMFAVKNNVFLPLMLIPISIIHFFIIKNTKKVFDWLSPIFLSIALFFGLEIINGNAFTIIQNIFPMFFGKELDIYYLWFVGIQILIIYGLYSAFSILIPARSGTMALTTLFLGALICINKFFIHDELIGFTLKIKDFFDLKRFGGLMLYFFKEKLDIMLLCQFFILFVIICLIAVMLNKNTSEYDLVKRIKSCVCGVCILILVYFSINLMIGSNLLPAVPNDTNQQYGFIYGFYTNPYSENEYSEELMEKIDAMLNKDTTEPPTQPAVTDDIKENQEETKDNMPETTANVDSETNQETTSPEP